MFEVSIYNPKNLKVESNCVFILDNSWELLQVEPFKVEYGLLNDVRIYRYSKTFWLHKYTPGYTKRRNENFVIGNLVTYSDENIEQALYLLNALHGPHTRRIIDDAVVITFDSINELERLKYKQIRNEKCYVYYMDNLQPKVDWIIKSKHHRIRAVGLKEVLERRK